MTMKRSHRIASILSLSSAVLFAHAENFDSYCGKTFAQNDCSLRCVSGTDQECIDILGEEYKCLTMTGCSDRIEIRELELMHANNRRTVGGGVCASSLKSAITGCDIREPCSIDLDCAATAGELCYSNIGCGTPLLVELTSEFKFTLIGVQSPMDQAAGSTLTQTLGTFLEPSLEESKIGLDTVSLIGDPQQLGVMLDVSVKFTGLYRPLVEQNLGGIIIEAFSGGTQTSSSSSLVIQNAFISSLNSQGSYYRGVSSILQTLEENGSRVIPSPTLAPTGPLPSPPPSLAPSSTVTVPIIDNNLPSTETEGELAGPLADEVLASEAPSLTTAPTAAPSSIPAAKVLIDSLPSTETEEFAGPLADELLASDLPKVAAKEIAAKEQANAAAYPVEETDPGGLGLGVIIGIVGVVLTVSIVVLGALYLQYEKKRISIVEKRLTMLEVDDAESDLDSNNDLESGEGSSMSSSSSDSLEGLRSPPGSRRASMESSFPINISLESEQKEMNGSNLMQSRHMKGEEDDRTFNSSDSNSNSSRSSDSQHSGAASGSDDSGTSSDDSSSDESDDSSRKAAAAAAMRKNFKRRISTDEEMKKEMLETWNNPFLKQHERVKKVSEIKSRRQKIKKLSKEAESESFQRSLNRIRGGKPRSSRRLSEVSSGSGIRKSMTRRNSMTRTMSSGSLGQSDGNLNLSSHSNTQKRRSSMVAERRKSSTKRNDLANSDQHLERKKLSLSVNSFNSSSSDLVTSDYHLEKKKLSSMKAWQRPQSRRLSM